jgi:hypothetical protein
VAAAFLLASPAMAQDQAPGPLPPGKPAGVKQAEINEVPYLLITAVGTLVLGFAVLHYGTSSSAPATTTP